MLGLGVGAARGGAQGTARVQGQCSLFSASDPIPQACLVQASSCTTQACFGQASASLATPKNCPALGTECVRSLRLLAVSQRTGTAIRGHTRFPAVPEGHQATTASPTLTAHSAPQWPCLIPTGCRSVHVIRLQSCHRFYAKAHHHGDAVCWLLPGPKRPLRGRSPLACAPAPDPQWDLGVTRALWASLPHSLQWG